MHPGFLEKCTCTLSEGGSCRSHLTIYSMGPYVKVFTFLTSIRQKIGRSSIDRKLMIQSLPSNYETFGSFNTMLLLLSWTTKGEKMKNLKSLAKLLVRTRSILKERSMGAGAGRNARGVYSRAFGRRFLRGGEGKGRRQRHHYKGDIAHSQVSTGW